MSLILLNCSLSVSNCPKVSYIVDHSLSGDNVPETSSSHLSEEKTGSATQPECANEGAMEAVNDTAADEDCISVPQEVKNTPEAVPISPINPLYSRTRTNWQPPMDHFFIDLMLEQVQKGNQIDGVFRKQAWVEMIASFNAKFGFNYDLDILKNRYKTLRRQYNVIKNLLELDGFAWDDARQMVTADDSVWQEYIKVCISVCKIQTNLNSKTVQSSYIEVSHRLL